MPAQLLTKQRENLTNQITDTSLQTILILKNKCYKTPAGSENGTLLAREVQEIS